VTAVLAAILVLMVAAFIILPFLRQAAVEHADARPIGNELWTREKAVAVLAITEADFDRATGKLSEDDYRILRTDYEGRALQAMDEIEKSTATSVDTGTVRFCASCGSPFHELDAFCGSCGQPRQPR
jgi:NADH pyrophosphatase NudC (nudix superfamily)